MDENWFEGSNERHNFGIFPVSYVEVIKQPLGNAHFRSCTETAL